MRILGMTDQELKDLVASLAEDRKETKQLIDQLAREAAARQEEAEARRKEIDRALQEAARIAQKTSEAVDKMSKKMGGIDENQGYHAEQFFQSVFEKKLEFGRIKYDEMIPNLAYKGKKDEIEFDIALVNGDSIALIEVKNRIHPNFVIELAEKRIEKFRKYFHEFDNYDVYLGIAGFSFSDEVLDRASTYGIGIVRQVGEGVEIEANNLKVY